MPGFGKFYVNVTTTGAPLTTHIREFEVSRESQCREPGSLREVLSFAQPQTQPQRRLDRFQSERQPPVHRLRRRRRRQRQWHRSYGRHRQCAGHHQQSAGQDAADRRQRRRLSRRRRPQLRDPADQPNPVGVRATTSATTRSGRLACAIRSATALTARPATCGSATSVRASAKRSTFSRPRAPAARTTAGGCAKDKSRRRASAGRPRLVTSTPSTTTTATTTNSAAPSSPAAMSIVGLIRSRVAGQVLLLGLA